MIRPVICERFSASDSDVTVCSREGIQFRIHRKNLETNTGRFPMDDFVHLTETATILELLFQFVYPRRHPDLETVAFEVLALLAEAAEKYEVFAALNVCKIHMRNILPDHAAEVLGYAARHGYLDIAQRAVLPLIRKPLTEVISALPQDLVIPWIKYHEEWTDVLRSASSCPSSHSRAPLYTASCDGWGTVAMHTFNRFGGRVEALLDLDEVFTITITNPAECCTIAASAWRERVEAQLKDIPEFVEYL